MQIISLLARAPRLLPGFTTAGSYNGLGRQRPNEPLSGTGLRIGLTSINSIQVPP